MYMLLCCSERLALAVLASNVLFIDSESGSELWRANGANPNERFIASVKLTAAPTKRSCGRVA